jgi:hypothetical protein
MKKRIAVLGLGVLMALGLRVASAGEDVRFWQVFGIDLTPVKRFKLYIEKQLRYEGTLTDMESDISEVGLRYKVTKWLDLRVDYRFESQYREKRDRVDGNVILGWNWKGFSLSNRFRLQKEFIETLSREDAETVFRDRLLLTLRPKNRLRPFAGGEIFLGLGEDGKKLDKFRLMTGLEYDVNSRVTLSFFYIYQRDLGEKTNESWNVLGGRFRYSF